MVPTIEELWVEGWQSCLQVVSSIKGSSGWREQMREQPVLWRGQENLQNCGCFPSGKDTEMGNRTPFSEELLKVQ